MQKSRSNDLVTPNACTRRQIVQAVGDRRGAGFTIEVVRQHLDQKHDRIRKLINSILCLSAFIALSCATSLDLIQDSQKKLLSGDHDGALVLARKAVEKFPDDGGAWHWLAQLSRRERKDDDAMQAYRRVIELKSSSGEEVVGSYSGIAHIFYGTRQYDEGISHARRGIQLYENRKSEPDFATELLVRDVWNLHLLVGWCYYELGLYDEATEAFNRVTSGNIRGGYANSLKGEGYFWKGYCNMRKEKYEDALSDLDVAVRKFEPDGKSLLKMSLIQRGLCNFCLGNNIAALKDLDRAIENPNSVSLAFRAELYRGNAFVKLVLGNREDAIHYLNKVSAIDTSYSNIDDLARIYYASGDKEKAWQGRGGMGYLGINVRDYEKKSTRGVRIVDIDDGSPAEKAGLKINDIITKINDDSVAGQMEFDSRTHALIPGTITRLHVDSPGIAREISVTIGSVERYIESEPLIARVLRNSKLQK